jgi:hypothetical protein
MNKNEDLKDTNNQGVEWIVIHPGDPIPEDYDAVEVVPK